MCGIAGVFNVENAETYVANMLFAIQHRGQESCGIATRNQDANILAFKDMGLVKNVLTPERLESIRGNISIGHVRYPTAGSSNMLNAQPHAIELAEGPQMAVCSNGDIINYKELRRWLEGEHHFTFKSDNDGELIGRLVAYYRVIEHEPIEKAIFKAQQDLKGGFSTLLMYRDQLFAFRDPHGLRPFVMGHIGMDDDPEVYISDSTAFASESCGFGIVGAKEIREVEPGEIIRLEADKPIESVSVAAKETKHCVFELIYFSRPDTHTFGEYVYDVRKKIGATLARLDDSIPLGDDLVVIPVPDSSNFVAQGYAEEKKAQFELGLLRNHYVGRTFIKPQQEMRDEGVKQKFNPLPGYFPGKRVILVDDSIVRGTTLRKIVRMIKHSGAKEVHVRVGSPKVIGSCYYGIDTPTKEELIANRMTEEEIAWYLNADSLRYLHTDDFAQILGDHEKFCYACFDLDYIYAPEDFAPKSNVPKAQTKIKYVW